MNENSNSDDFEIEDVENWRGGEANKFSHQDLIMESLRSILQNGAKDLRKGFWNNKIDRHGNAIKIWEEDTRQIYINSVKNLIMISHRDWKDSPTYKDIITKKIQSIDIRREYWKNEELKWWNSMNNLQKMELTKQNKQVYPGMFNENNDFDDYFMKEEENIYREIATIILDFIKDEMRDFEGITLIG